MGLFFLLRKAQRPKATAYAKGKKAAFYEKVRLKGKRHPHASVVYSYKSIDYERLILLVNKKVEEGDELIVSFKSNKPDEPQLYALKQEVMTVMLLYTIGLGLLDIIYYLSNQL